MPKTNFRFSILIIVAVLAATFLFFLRANAATCNVPAVYATIQAAIDDPLCDTIVIQSGTFTENLLIPRNVAIIGAGTSLDASTTRLMGGFVDRVIDIPYNGSDQILVSISNLNIENGDVRSLGGVNSYGGGIYNAETLTLDNVLFTNNFANSGGALATGAYAHTTIHNSLITHNAATIQADNIYNGASLGSFQVTNSQVDGPASSVASVGGIYTNGPTLIQNSNILGHSAGGLYAYNGDVTIENTNFSFNGKYGVSLVGLNSTPMTAVISNSIIENNYAVSTVGDDGEGLAVTANVLATVNTSSVIGNGKEGIETTTNLGYTPSLTVTASFIQNNRDGGVDASGDVTILDTQISGNLVTYYGNGGIDHNGGDLVVERSDIRENQGALLTCGGGIVTGSSTAFIRDTIIAFNQGANGAGLCLLDATATIQRTTIASNTATDSGGGIFLGYNGAVTSLVMANSTLANNIAGTHGAGIYALSGSADLYNVTIARNQADSDNNASGMGGGYRVEPMQPVTLNMANSLVALNTQGASVTSDCSGAILSGGTNLVRIADSCSGFVASDLTGTSVSPLNAVLGQLQNNGGFTPTIA
ncbi:MAG TPA: right-handed parallel beta-helix repeat-containing protein, partial [Anaerolineales bacterium]|nr:right-handed parallel beta-helix repeat-containing protein [Anaerolineales bacterium]